MNDALVYLARREYTNAVRRRIRRLREPRYLLALAAALVYIALLLPRRADTVTPASLAGALPIAPLLGRAIREVFDDGSVTSLFDGIA